MCHLNLLGKRAKLSQGDSCANNVTRVFECSLKRKLAAACSLKTTQFYRKQVHVSSCRNITMLYHGRFRRFRSSACLCSLGLRPCKSGAFWTTSKDEFSGSKLANSMTWKHYGVKFTFNVLTWLAFAEQTSRFHCNETILFNRTSRRWDQFESRASSLF